jgi:hypothetical protein
MGKVYRAAVKYSYQLLAGGAGVVVIADTTVLLDNKLWMYIWYHGSNIFYHTLHLLHYFVYS